MDLGAVIRRERLRFVRTGAAWSAGYGGWRARVQGAQAYVTPLQKDPGAARREAAPLAVRTSSILRAGQRVDAEPTGAIASNHDTLVISRGNVREELKALDAGLQQQWMFDQPPSGGGDLVVTVRVSGEDYAGETSGGQHFVDRSAGLGVRYGQATWIDGAGTRIAVRPSWDGQSIVLRVPSAVLDASRWPAVLDPVISGEISLDVPAAATNETEVAVGAGTNAFLAVWTDDRTTTTDLYAVRLSLDGTVKDNPALRLTTDAGAQDQPAVGFDGTQFMVLYRDDGGSGEVYGVNVPLIGAAGAPFSLIKNAKSQSNPALAWDAASSTYLVTWTDGTNATPDIFGIRMSGTGTASGSTFTICSAADAQGASAVANDGKNHLVVWTDRRSGTDEDVNGVLVDGATGSIVGSEIKIASGALDQTLPAVAFGTNFLVLWQDGAAGATNIMGARVDTSGAVLDAGGFTVSNALASQAAPAVANDGAQFLAVWQDDRNGMIPNAWDVYGARITYAGKLLDAAGVAISSDGAVVESAPAIASAKNGLSLVGYTSGTTATRSKARTVQYALPPGATCTTATECETGFCADGVCCNTACGNGDTTDCQACSIAAGGTVDGVCGIRTNGTSCSDGIACTLDTCQSGLCVGVSNCTASDQCHEAGTCDSGTGLCSNPVKADGATCNDGNGCTQTDTCQAGLCTGANPVVCTAGECQLPGTCNPGTGVCSAPTNKGVGTACGSSADTDCDNPDTCDGAGACATNHEPSTTLCGDAASACVNQDQCDGNGACHDNGFKPLGAACGSPADTECDNPDTCDATGTCLANNEPVTANCGDAASDCVNQDKCDGTGSCHDNGFKAVGTACGSASDTDCDNPDTCNATGACLANNEPTSTNCGDAASDCVNQDKCDGVGACHDNGFKAVGTACGSASDTDCDNPDTCSATGTCIENHEPVTTNCGDTGAECVNQDKCDGNGACHDNGFKAVGTACGSPSDTECDNPDTCNAAGTCVLNHEPTTTSCGAVAGECEVQDKCDGTGACHDNGFKAVGAACGSPADTECTNPDTCNGTGTCLANHEPVTTNCGDTGTECVNQDKCDGSGACHDNGFKAAGTTCGSAADTECDKPDSCNATGTCLPNHEPVTTNCGDTGTQCINQDKCNGSGSCTDNGYKSSTTACNDNNACTQTDTCNGTGTCVGGNPKACTALDQCHDAGVCDTTSGVCSNPAKTDGTACMTDGNPCTRDICVSGGCSHPAGNLNSLCRPAVGDCGVAEYCDGVSENCPEDLHKPNGTACPADSHVCSDDVCTDGQCTHPPTAQGTLCRDAVAFCDAVEVCNGTSLDCPNDVKKPNTTVCRPQNGDCDVADYCNGGNACPSDGYAPATQTCRAASCSAGTAILQAKCTGTGPSCPGQQTQTCSPYVCNNTACGTACAQQTDCTTGFYCETLQCKPKKANGLACTTDVSCQSARCVDGVCCNLACTGQCQACDVTGFVGTCTPVTGKPHGTRSACASDGTACGGSCNGVLELGCTYPGNTVQCRAASCANDIAILQAMCTGSGSCPGLETKACSPFKCSGTQCGGDCTIDTDCASGSYCAAGICTPKSNPGVACTANNQCKSNNCVDGVCCNGPCAGQCEACDVATKVGTCSPVVGTPHGTRPSCQTDGSACGGTCDGILSSTCNYPTVQCRPPACSNEVATLAASCDGMGACPPQQYQPCAPFKCGGAQCAGTCAVDTDCAGVSYCSGGVCHVKSANGFSCAGDNQCSSGYCVDGVCCSSGCVGQCEACNKGGSEGTCLPVTGAPHGPRPQCSTDGSVCGGACDGANTTGCAYPDATVQCRGPACSNNVATLSANCVGTGSCPGIQTQACSPFLCVLDQCVGNCTLDTDCATGSFCAGGVCKVKIDLGQSCGGNNQCNSAYCADGVCCDTECIGQCEACDVQGAVGTCSAVIGAPHGGKAACAGAGTCQGSCDGIKVNECVFPSSAVECSAAQCANGVQTAAASCDGAGTCPTPATAACGNFACGATECLTTCSNASDCKSGLICVGQQCVVPEAGPEGGADAADAQPDQTGPSEAGTDAKSDVPTDGQTDALADTANDQGQGSGGTSGAAVDESKDQGGCGCSAPGRSPRGAILLGLLALAAVAARRRHAAPRA